MKIYMDNCCYYRPFDDQTQDRVLIETNAIMSILYRCQTGEWQLIGSDILEYEMSKVKNETKFQRVSTLYELALEKVVLTQEIEMRAKQLEKLGIKALDSLHIASAESIGADVYLTTDDGILRKYNANDFHVRIMNPVEWLMEVLRNEQ